MGLFSKIFSPKQKLPRGFHAMAIDSVKKHNDNTVEIRFTVPQDLIEQYHFVPGQYMNIEVEIDNEPFRRSYSICSSPEEGLAIAVKKVAHGKVSNWLFDHAKAGMELLVSSPEGRFVLPEGAKSVVAFAAGSGITPVLSIAKSFKKGSFQLHYGNRTLNSILFKEELDSLGQIKTTYVLSQENAEGCPNGRIDNQYLSALIRSDLGILKADVFLICGPEEMIHAAKESLSTFSVSDSKIIYELFTTPVIIKSESQGTESNFAGKVDLQIQLDGEEETIVANEQTVVLDAALKSGLDAPYSCRGGVCSTCKCKIVEGSAKMRINYILTDQEIQEGYLLSCQATPTSSVLKITYDV